MADDQQKSRHEARPYQVRLPGFLTDEEIGLGQAVKRAASSFGIGPCAGCERRAAALNRWVAFTGKRTTRP